MTVSARTFLGLLAAAVLAGCDGQKEIPFTSLSRLDSGLVVILPGIEGKSLLNESVRRGLIRGGVYRAMPIFRWGNELPIAGPFINQIDVARSRRRAKLLANEIVEYQDAFPGRPVHLVGHSGGGGIAVFTAEALPEGRMIDGLILLAPSLSADYDLAPALRHCREGIVNFYTRADVGLLMIGTTVVGNVDGKSGPAAGAVAFRMPEDNPGPWDKLYQIDTTDWRTFAFAHAAVTRAGWVADYVSPWVLRHWPAAGSDHDEQLAVTGR